MVIRGKSHPKSGDQFYQKHGENHGKLEIKIGGNYYSYLLYHDVAFSGKLFRLTLYIINSYSAFW